MNQTMQVLTPQKIKEINMSLGSIINLRELLNKAEQCGMDVSAYRAELDTSEAQLNAWKKTFAPMSS